MNEQENLQAILALLMKARDNQFLAKEIGAGDLQTAIMWLNNHLKTYAKN